MPRFAFRAVDGDGQVLDSHADAQDRASLVAQLQSRGLLAVRIALSEEAGERRPRRERLARFSSTNINVALLTEELATLLKSGIALSDALAAIMDGAGNRGDRRFLETVFSEIRAGRSFADALVGFEARLPVYYIGVIRAAQASGTLDSSMLQLAETMRRQKSIKDSVRSALLYPMVVLAVSLACVYVLISFVLPQFADLFKGSGTAVPAGMAFLLGLSDFAEAYGLALLLCCAMLAWLTLRWLRTPAGRASAERLALRIPGVSALWRRVIAARFSRTLAALLGSGAALLSALALAAQSTNSRAMEEATQRLSVAVRQGSTLAEGLSQIALVPRLMTRLVGVGERSGQLERMLHTAADHFEADIRKSTERLVALLVPGATIVLGLIVGGIAATMLSAILDSYDLAG